MAEVTPSAPYSRLAVPPYIAYCITGVFVAILAAFTVLAINDADTTELRAWLNTLLNFGGIVLGGGGVAYAASADRKAGKAAEQTNGGLDLRIEAAAERAATRAIQKTTPLDSASVADTNRKDTP